MYFFFFLEKGPRWKKQPPNKKKKCIILSSFPPPFFFGKKNMSLKEALGNLTQNTKRFASVAFADYEYSPEVSRLLSKQPKLIREANESESMLYNYYNGHENIKSM